MFFSAKTCKTKLRPRMISPFKTEECCVFLRPLYSFYSSFTFRFFMELKWRVGKGQLPGRQMTCPQNVHQTHALSSSVIKNGVYHLELVSRDAKARSDSSMSRLYECDRSSRNTCFSRRRSLRSEGFPFHFGVRVEQCACCGHVKG